MTDPQYEKPRLEHFEVVLIKQSASDLTAKPEDFKRVPVKAADTIAALNDPAVEKELGEYRRLWATTPGVLTGPEMEARHRAYDGGVQDRTKIGF